MATQVIHGPRPKFKAKFTPGSARMVIVSHYTTTPGLGAAGVTEMRYNSRRQRKRRAELLNLRSAFVGFFLEEWIKNGGTWTDGVAALNRYPFDRVRVKLGRHRSMRVRLAVARSPWIEWLWAWLWSLKDRR